MNVAAATSAVSRPFAFMTPRGSDAVETGAGTRTPTAVAPADPQPDAGGTDPLVNRFPTIAFSYDTDASRLVMLYRDPANGKTVSQIPTEAALKQYKEAQQKEKNAERASLLKLTVGGDGQGNGQASGQAGSQSAAHGRGASPVAGTGLSAGTGTSTSGVSASTAAPVALAASAPTSSVAQSPPTATGSTTNSAGGSAARVNVVI